MRTRRITPPFPVDLRHTLAPLQRGEDDPALRFAPDGTIWRATATPAGPATLALRGDGNRIEARAWGDGAEAALEQLPALTGCLDTPHDLEAGHATVAAAAHRFAGLRLSRTGAVFDAALAAVLARRLTRFEAHRAHRLLTMDYGTPAPGPGGLRVAPDAAALGSVPYFELQVRGVDAAQADTIARLCAHRAGIEALADRPSAEAQAALVKLRGIDAGIAAAAALEALADPDAVPLGDPELAHLVTAALGGEPSAHDGPLVEALEPWRGQRGRVVRLLQATAAAPAPSGHSARAH